ncbi:hypothetical protein Droror1_Dr00005827 [Drosera rotundifolia]
MLNFYAAKGVYPKVEVIPIDYVNEALKRLIKRDVKYRFVIDTENSLNLDLECPVSTTRLKGVAAWGYRAKVQLRRVEIRTRHWSGCVETRTGLARGYRAVGRYCFGVELTIDNIIALQVEWLMQLQVKVKMLMQMLVCLVYAQ